MGVKVTIGGQEVHPSNYRITESSTPIAGGDSSGAVGTISVNVSKLPLIPASMNLEDDITLLDSNRGTTLGTIRSIEADRGGAPRYTVTADNLLGDFNIEVSVAPKVTTLTNIVREYCALAGIPSSKVAVSGPKASVTYRFPGWQGNLWVNLKELATGMGYDLNLINGIVTFRPIRAFSALKDRETQSTYSADGTSLALKQQVTWYDTVHSTSGLIYPPGGWTPEVRVLSVNAGETTETTLETNASIISLQQPAANVFVPKDFDDFSVYTVIGDDGIPIQPAQWADYGGRLSVSISEDYHSIIVKMTGATGLVQANGNPIRTFRIGTSSGTSADDTYSTLRINGNHIQLNPKTITIPTGLDSSRTSEEFAPAIDSVFLTSLNDAYSAGTRGARRHAGRTLTYRASVTALSRRGETGSEAMPSYSYVKSLFPGQTYAVVKGQVNPSVGTYGGFQRAMALTVQNSFDNQIFGNAPGARIWDQESGRWYRIRNATTEWGTLSVDAEDDMTNGDMKTKFTGQSYGQVKTHYGSNTYYKANLRGAA